MNRLLFCLALPLSIASIGCSSPQPSSSIDWSLYPTCAKWEKDTTFASGTYLYNDGSDGVKIVINNDSTLTYFYRGEVETVPIWLVKSGARSRSGYPFGEKEEVKDYGFSVYPSKIANDLPRVYQDVFHQRPRDMWAFDNRVFFDGCVGLSISLDGASPKAAICYTPIGSPSVIDSETGEERGCTECTPIEIRFIRQN